MAMTTEDRDHDVLKGRDIAKGPASADRPHADGCVGCRRANVCIKCGKPSLLGAGRCISGACEECCAVIHKHVGGDRNNTVTYEAH